MLFRPSTPNLIEFSAGARIIITAYIIKFILFYKYYTKETAILILLNILLSLPAFYYIVYLDINFFNESAAIGLDQNKNRIFFNNIFNDILITFTLLFFYLIPFLLTKTISIFKIGNIAIAITIIPMPPSHCNIALHSKIDLAVLSKS